MNRRKLKENCHAQETAAPIHPGEILREEFMKPLGLSANVLAQRVGVTTARVNEIASERRGITADTCAFLRLLPSRMLKKSASGVLAALKGSTLSRSVSDAGSLEGLFRSPRPIIRANGPHKVRYVPPRLFARCGLAGRPF